mgnify:CR=1 FL=1
MSFAVALVSGFKDLHLSFFNEQNFILLLTLPDDDFVGRVMAGPKIFVIGTQNDLEALA